MLGILRTFTVEIEHLYCVIAQEAEGGNKILVNALKMLDIIVVIRGEYVLDVGHYRGRIVLKIWYM